MSVHSDDSAEENIIQSESTRSIPPARSGFSVFNQSKKEIIRLTYLDNPALVCDNGTYSLKVGFAGDDAPRTIIPTFVGSPRQEVSMPGYGQRITYVGDYAVQNRGVLDTSAPIENGIITDWEAMEQMYYHMYYEDLMLPPEGYNILHTEPPLNPKPCREKLAEMMFELFNVPGMFMVPAATLALYASGKATGIVVDCGYDSTRAVPVYEGYCLPHAVRTLPVGGRQVTESLANMMNARGFSFTTPADKAIVNAIKEKLCYCVIDPNSEEYIEYNNFNHPDIEKLYEMPDGQTITIYSEAYRAPEVMFDPATFNITSKLTGIHNMVYESIGVCDIRLQNDMYNNIVMAGGNSILPSLSQRVERMLAKLALSTTKIRLLTTPEQKFSTWIGGSIMASLPTFKHMWVNRAEYEEHGPKSVHHKCF